MSDGDERVRTQAEQDRNIILQRIRADAQRLVDEAKAAGFVVRISNAPADTPEVGGSDMAVDVWPQGGAA